MPSANDAMFIISLMHHSCITQGDTSLIPYLKSMQNLPFPAKFKNFCQTLLAFNSLNSGKTSEALGLFKDIQIQNPNTKAELLALFEEFHVFLYYLLDSNKAAEIVNKMKAKFPDNSLTILAENELEAAKCINPHQRLLREKYADNKIKSSTVPKTFQVFQNYPNPFNPITTISYTVPEKCDVEIVIYDILGRRVKSLLNTVKEVGEYRTVWNGIDDLGHGVSSGIYLYRIEMKSIDSDGHFGNVKKMMLLR